MLARDNKSIHFPGRTRLTETNGPNVLTEARPGGSPELDHAHRRRHEQPGRHQRVNFFRFCQAGISCRKGVLWKRQHSVHQTRPANPAGDSDQKHLTSRDGGQVEHPSSFYDEFKSDAH